jgi:hypothetical protein
MGQVMGIFDRFLKPKKAEKPAEVAPKQPSVPKIKVPEKTAKQLATEAGEPYVTILSMDIDPANLHQGSFELDWNEIFVARLIKAGYQGKVDADIVDQWFQNVCRHVVMETWEQEQAIKNSGIWVQSKDIGNGRSEVS